MIAKQVIEFNQTVLGIEQRKINLIPDHEADISKRCLDEEVQEFIEAHQTGDLIGVADSMFDLIYFAVGVLYKSGFNAEMINEGFTLVHKANMTKKRGQNAKRAVEGAVDAIKPEGWVSPEERIGEMLDRYEAKQRG